MKARYVQRGDAIDYTPAAAVGAGDVVRLGGLVGVAKLDIAAGELGALALRGVYELALKAGKSFTAGQKAYFDPADGTVSPDVPGGSSAAFAFGFAVAAAAEGDALVHVLLEQGL